MSAIENRLAESQIRKLQEVELLLKQAAEECRSTRWLVPEAAFLDARRVLLAAMEKVEREAARSELQHDLGFRAQL